MNLSEYAATNPTKPASKCWACGIPEREEFEAEYRKGVAMSVIVAWLQRVKGYKEANKNRISNHLKCHLG